MRAANRIGLPSSGGVMAEVARDIATDSLGVFVGFGAEPETLVIGQVPVSAFQFAPMVLLAYVEQADRELVDETGRRFSEWIKACGFDCAMALNLRHSDRAFCRGFARFGAPKKMGSMIRFSL
jgi:hypothetical protein